MKPVTTIVVILLIIISIAHMLRLIFQVEIIAGGFHIPVWLSIFGFIIPLVLALLLWRENRKGFSKEIIPLKIIRKKDNQ
jgi:membrane protein implicated in regulation of membrane protease activity